MSTVQKDQAPPGTAPPKTWHDRVNYRLAVWGITVGGVAAIVTPLTPVYDTVYQKVIARDPQQDLLTTVTQRVGDLEKDKPLAEEVRKKVEVLAWDLKRLADDLAEAKVDARERDRRADEMKSKIDVMTGLLDGLAGRKSR